MQAYGFDAEIGCAQNIVWAYFICPSFGVLFATRALYVAWRFDPGLRRRHASNPRLYPLICLGYELCFAIACVVIGGR